MGDVVEGEFHVIGVERVAIVEGYALAQFDGVFQTVLADFPAFGKARRQVAVDVALANLRANDLEGRVKCVEAAGFDHPELHSAAPFDLVFANILKGPLVALAPDLAAHTASDGYAILSGILNEQADAVISVYAQNGFNLIVRDEIVEWTTLTLQKNRA